VNKVTTFHDLDVYQRAYAISLEIHRASLEFPRIEQFVLADQMRRASKSICANIAEGFGRQRQSRAEYRRFLLMAVGSADEMQVWTRYAVDLGYTTPEVGRRWADEYLAIARMLQAVYTAWSS
jgi:four helix bundle protein